MRRVWAVSSFLAGSLLAIGGLASATLAQDASPIATAESPVVGAWLLDVDGDPDSAPTVAIFHADGTYIQEDQGANVAIGSWEPNGPNTGAVTFTWYGVDESGAYGSSTVRATVEVAADGTSLTAVYTLEFIGPDGTSSDQMGPGTATGTRIAVEPMGSPVAPLGPSGADATAQTLDVTLAEFSVAVSPATVKAGQPITFAVTNAGAETHEMVLEKAGDDDVPLEADGVESEIEDILPGATAEMVWTITEPGTYQLACHIPDHFEKGMVTTLEVVA